MTADIRSRIISVRITRVKARIIKGRWPGQSRDTAVMDTPSKAASASRGMKARVLRALAVMPGRSTATRPIKSRATRKAAASPIRTRDMPTGTDMPSWTTQALGLPR
jgi:hypothetical protein